MAHTRFLLLRHAQSTWNAVGRWQGWGDPPLSQEGRLQASRAAEWLGATWPSLAEVVSSDLRRARDTAGPMAQRLRLGPVVLDQGVRERDLGEWTGLTAEQIEAAWPGQLARFRDGSLVRPPRGESTAELTARAMAALERLRDRCPGRDLLVVCHGGVVRAVEAHLGAPPEPLANLCGRWVEHEAPGGREGSWQLGPQVEAQAAAAER